MHKRALLLLLVPLLLCFLAVHPAEGRSPRQTFEVYTGGASFYSDSFHGRKTANGERYNKKDFTAAHRSLPMGTIVRVTNLSSGQHLLVRINDRGPLKKKWILDVSRAAATRLHMLRKGVINVQVEVVADAAGFPVLRGNAFFLQIAGARNKADAERTVQRLTSSRVSQTASPGVSIRLFREGMNDSYFVGIGPFRRYNEALNVYNRLRQQQPDTSILCLPLALANKV